MAALGAFTAAAAATSEPGCAQGVARLALEQYTLPNGLEVILHEDHAIPVVAVNTCYHVGWGDERTGRRGFANLSERIVLMGSEHVPVGAFGQWLGAAGAFTGAGTSEDRTTYYEQMPSVVLPLALSLDADRMGWLLPTVDQSKLDLQREAVESEHRGRIQGEPYARVEETIHALLFPRGHPYSRPMGTTGDLRDASLGDVRAFLRTYYAPNNATMVIAGDFRPDSAKRWVARYFGQIPRGLAVPPRPRAPLFTVLRDTSVVLPDRVRVPHLFYAWHTVKAYHPDDAALSALAYILAGDKTSRLYRTLVSERQVADNVSAAQEAHRLDGMFELQATAKADTLPAVVDRLVAAGLRGVIDSGVTEDELKRAKAVRRAQILDGVTNVADRADLLNYYNLIVGAADYFEQDAARYERLTVDDIRRVAASYLDAHKVTILLESRRQKVESRE